MMKRLFTALAAFLLLGYGLGAQYRTSLQDLDDSETVRALKQHVAALSAAELEGRRAGSEGEKMAAEYLEDWLREYGIDILSSGNEFGVAVGADTVHSRNVTGFLQGWDKSLNKHYIVIGARMDNLGMDTLMVNGEPTRRIYYGANGNASGMAMLLELAQKLSYARTLLRRSILFVGFGASQETFAGSWYFLHRAFADDASNIDAMVNLDMLGTPGRGFYAFTSSNEDLNTIASALKGELLPVQAQLTNQQPYPGDNAVFYDAEIPSVLFTTGRYPEHGTGEDSFDIIDFEGMEGELEYIYSYVQRLCNGQRPLFRNNSAAPKESAPAGVYSYSDVDVKPMFLNSPDPAIFLERWVYQYVKYPKYAVENGIQGRVLVNFVINEKGEVQDVTVSRGVHGVLDDEAVRVVSASPKWRPGRFHGKKVKTAMTVAVDFKLDKKKGTFGINGITIK
ncbi:MAG: TonB family protein [Bacteroidales bacterium]|nr:TonB family protein [Bacteroidales bacterium]